MGVRVREEGAVRTWRLDCPLAESHASRGVRLSLQSKAQTTRRRPWGFTTPRCPPMRPRHDCVWGWRGAEWVSKVG